jgi:hypothetical protein
MGSKIQWLHSFVSGDTICCLDIAPDDHALRTHSEKGHLPANHITKVRIVIDPTTAEEAA